MLGNTFILLSSTGGGFLSALNDPNGLNLGDIIVTVVFFTVLMVLLKKFAWGPLMGVMNQRAELIANEIEAAEKAAWNLKSFWKSNVLF